MIITATERGIFKRCRRRWFYSSQNHMNIEKIVPRQSLGLGTLVHKALADWINQPDTILSNYFMTYANEQIDHSRKAYFGQVGAEISDAEIGPLYDYVMLGRSMCDNYQAFWKSPVPAGFKVIMPEQQLHIDIPHTNNVLECKLDGVIADKTGRLFVLEHKTFGAHPQESSLQMNDQFICYIWALSQMGIGEVVGLAYDGLWKRSTPPRGKSMSDLFLRMMIYRGKHELREFETYLAEESLDMEACGSFYTNRRIEGCADCDYELLCSAKSRGEDVDYFLKMMYTQRQTDA